VTSPIGDFPFTPRKVRLDGASIVLEGAMGAWPATVRVEPRDIPELIRVIPTAVFVAVGATVAGGVLGWSRRRR
jgi:hypothetical protein